MDAAMLKIANTAFLAAVIGGVVFLVLYSTTTRWWSNITGRVLFSFMTVIASILLLAGVRLAFGPYPGITYIRPIAYVSLALAMWSLVGILVYGQIYKQIKRHRAKSDLVKDDVDSLK